MGKWNPWKVTALGMALVMATALITGLVVANWSGSSQDAEQKSWPPASTRLVQQPRPTSVRPAPPQTVQAGPATPAMPTQQVVDACNRYASSQVGESGGKGAGKGAAIGGMVGAGGGTLYGLNENKKNDEKYRGAYSGCMRSRGYAG